MNKAFDNFTWEDSPSTNTPLSAANLNKINSGLNTVDNRVISLDTSVGAKSTVSVSASGTATDEVQYITVDGTEKKLAGGSGVFICTYGTTTFTEITTALTAGKTCYVSKVFDSTTITFELTRRTSERYYFTAFYDIRYSGEVVCRNDDSWDFESDSLSTVSVSASGTATDEIEYITVNGTEKKIKSGGGDDVSFGTNSDIVVSDGTNIAVVANPTLSGGETTLTGLQVGNTKYAVGGGGDTHLYRHIIHFYANNSPISLHILCEVISTDATAMTYDSFKSYLSTLTALTRLPASGWFYGSDTSSVADIFYYSNNIYCTYVMGSSSYEVAMPSGRFSDDKVIQLI